MERFDLVIIGCGPAGEKAAAQAGYHGLRAAVVEQADEPGGAAVHTGTLPSKTLRETALYLSGYRNRDLYGVSVRIDDPHTAIPLLIGRKDTIRRYESARMRRNLHAHKVALFQGRARLADPNHVEVHGRDGEKRVLRGDRIVIATGSVPFRPADIPFGEREIYDSDEILSLDRLPASMIVVGGGVIGCEYACMFAALGTRVTIVDTRDWIMPFLDQEIRIRLTRAMESMGIRFRLRAIWEAVEHVPGCEVRVRMRDGATECAETLLFAAGRSGNTRDLGLEELGVGVNSRGHVIVDGNYQTAVPTVYAVGDVIGFPALASTAMEQGRVAVCHAFGLPSKQKVSALLPYGIYTIPEVSTVGLSEEEARSRGVDYVVGRSLYVNNARGMITGDTEGMTKLVVCPHTRRLLGVHVVGERASELVHIGQAVMQLNGSVTAFIDMVFNYPTLSESYKYAAYDALARIDRGEFR